MSQIGPKLDIGSAEMAPYRLNFSLRLRCGLSCKTTFSKELWTCSSVVLNESELAAWLRRGGEELH
jgi:hypothetical protein